MHAVLRFLAAVAAVAVVSSLSPAARAAGAQAAHVHGAVTVDLAVEGSTLVIDLEAPLESLLGFERAPRTEAERQAARAMLEALRAGQGLFVPDPEAGCTLASARADAPALRPGAAPGDAHADLDAGYTYTCARPGALRRLDLGGLLDRHPRIARVEVRGALPAGQFRQVLRRPQRAVTWGR